MKELRIPIMVSILILLILVIVCISGALGSKGRTLLKVTFLDVGQGDATFIESPSGTQVLIDGGKGNIILGQLQKVMGFFDKDIDMVIATHPDLDHVGGLIHVLDRYKVDTILMTENVTDTPAFEVFVERANAEGAKIIYARRGQVFDLGGGAQGSTTFSILFPDHNPRGLESNTASIVGRLVYGESEYMLTGDSPNEIEEYLVRLGENTLASDVLKAGHHGSRTSSSEIFLVSVHPTYAIISAGKDNSYGHPHKEVTDRFTAHDVIQKSTADEGIIFSESNGINIWFR